jgi:hypothetical protein
VRRDDIGFIVGIFLLFCVVAFLVFFVDCMSCSSRAKVMRKRYQYGIMSGCMIEVKPQEFVPIDSYRVVE